MALDGWRKKATQVALVPREGCIIYHTDSYCLFDLEGDVKVGRLLRIGL